MTYHLRSNRHKNRLETLYFALGELEFVVNQLRQILHLHPGQDIHEEDRKAKKSIVTALGFGEIQSGNTFIDSFLHGIRIFRSLLLDAFLQPLIDAFPVHLPTEILVRIWKLTQPHLTLPVEYISLKEARKYLLLLKTTVLAVYNASLGKAQRLLLLRRTARV